MTTMWEANDRGNQSHVLNQGKVNQRHDMVITTMFCNINVTMFHGVQTFVAHGQWMQVSCIMIDIDHGAHHGCDILYGTT